LIAITITIMVLEVKVPHGTELASLRPRPPRAIGLCLLTNFDRPRAPSLSYASGMTRHALPLVAVLAVLATPAGSGELRASLEGGAAWQTRNDFRIPGDGGTPVELAEYESGPFAAVRASLTWDLTPRQSLRLLAAPLRVETTFTPQSPVASKTSSIRRAAR
jgi:hypothetical protein